MRHFQSVQSFGSRKFQIRVIASGILGLVGAFIANSVALADEHSATSPIMIDCSVIMPNYKKGRNGIPVPGSLRKITFLIDNIGLIPPEGIRVRDPGNLLGGAVPHQAQIVSGANGTRSFRIFLKGAGNSGFLMSVVDLPTISRIIPGALSGSLMSGQFEGEKLLSLRTVASGGICGLTVGAMANTRFEATQ